MKPKANTQNSPKSAERISELPAPEIPPADQKPASFAPEDSPEGESAINDQASTRSSEIDSGENSHLLASEETSAPEDEVGELVQRLQLALDATRGRNKQLLNDIADAEERRQEAEQRATLSELQATETQHKLRILEDLKNEGYRTVVTELFEQPSQQAQKLTLRVAVVSILAGVVISVLVSFIQTIVSKRLAAEANQVSADSTAMAIRLLAQSLRQELVANVAGSEKRTRDLIEQSEARGKTNLQRMVSIMTDPDLREGGLVDLQPNLTIQLSVTQSGNRYFRVAVPPSTPAMRISVYPIAGNPDLFIAYGRVPRPGEPTMCQSTWPGQTPDGCFWASNPQAGEYYVRVSGVGGPATFKIQAVF
jgi:hypothetical protein